MRNPTLQHVLEYSDVTRNKNDPVVSLVWINKGQSKPSMEAGNAPGHLDKGPGRLLVTRKLFDKISICVLTALAHGSLCFPNCSDMEPMRVGRHIMPASIHKVLISNGVMLSKSG